MTHNIRYNNCLFCPPMLYFLNPPVPFLRSQQPSSTIFVCPHSGVKYWAVNMANAKVSEPRADSSGWISAQQSKCWELYELQWARRQHFPSHAFSPRQIVSYYLTPLLFPQWPNNIVSAILSSLRPHSFTQECARWNERSLVVFKKFASSVTAWWHSHAFFKFITI